MVVDLAAGSCTTAIACTNTRRNCICIEKDKEIFDVGRKRVVGGMDLFLKESVIIQEDRG